MAEVGFAGGAEDLDADHAVGGVAPFDDAVAGEGGEEGGPAAVAVELLGGAEEFGAAGAAGVDAFGGGVGVFTDVGWFGAGAAEDVEFLRGEALAPLVVADQLEVGHARSLQIRCATRRRCRW